MTDDDPLVRAAALRALARAGDLQTADVVAGARDDAPEVRRSAAELAAQDVDVDLTALLHDDVPEVVEVAAWAAGEHGVADGALLETLGTIARTHDDAMCRESAVAALGAIGDERGRAVILDALSDRPAVRRRAVLALAPFDGPDIDEALTRALSDRDWQVRQAAEDLRGPEGPAA